MKSKDALDQLKHFKKQINTHGDNLSPEETCQQQRDRTANSLSLFIWGNRILTGGRVRNILVTKVLNNITAITA